jgi:hypothetical protein
MRRYLLVTSITLWAVVAGGILRDAIYARPNSNVDQDQPYTGEIEGRVLDADGRPVGEAVVYAEANGISNELIPSARTNGDGLFRIAIVPGVYRIYAGKESEGYPESMSPIYRGAVRSTRVAVHLGETTGGVVLRVGPKLGRLTGSVIDGTTRKPIADVTITLRLAHNQAISLETNVDEGGHFTFIAPLRAFTIEAKASGYEDWSYTAGAAGQKVTPLKVVPNSTTKLTVSMRRLT